MAKSIEQLMGDLQDPEMQEKSARYQNARDAVAWAYKMAQDKIDIKSASTLEGTAINIVTLARHLMVDIENDLNKTLDVLKEKNEAEPTKLS